MQHVKDVIDEYEEKLLACWTSAANADGPPRAGSTERISPFLHELRAAVAAAALEDVPSLARPRAEEDDDAAGGGDVVAETRAFGALHTLILELANDRGVVISPAEQLTLASHVNAAVARATEIRLRERDQDVWRAAHQLRNPLASAMMALTLLRSRVDLGESARLADTLERNLKRIQGLIDESVPESRSSLPPADVRGAQ